MPNFLWQKLFLTNKKKTSQTCNRKFTKGDSELHIEVTAQTDVKLLE